MKQIGILTVALLFFTLQVNGQARREAQRDRVEAQRIAFMTDKLELTPEESQAFWPIFNEYQDKIKEQRTSVVFENKNVWTMTDEQADAAIEKYLTHHQALLDLKKTYLYKFKDALPSSKVVRVFPADEAFKREILRRIRK